MRGMEEDYTRFRRRQPAALGEREVGQIRALAQDLPALWHAQTTATADRQQIIRFLVERVAVDSGGEGDRVRVYLDVEGNPEEGFDYLVGLIVVAGAQEQRYSFWADTRDQEGDIFKHFLAVVGRYDDYLVFAYGGYERSFLKRMRKLAKKKAPVDRVLKSLVNVLSLVYAHFYFPTYSNGLKDVGACLGCCWSDADASGVQSIVWRRCWESTRDPQWKQRLTTYNLEDCAALKRVTEFVYAAGAALEAATGPRPGVVGDPPVASVQDLDRAANERKWGKVRFFHPDFEYVNDCAYFDYQRQRVFVRTSRTLKRNRKIRGTQANRKLRISRRVQITSSKCPACGGREIIRWEHGRRVTNQAPRCKRAFDLVFTRGGIKRRVIECRTPYCSEAVRPSALGDVRPVAQAHR
jgi:hypothetical protein